MPASRLSSAAPSHRGPDAFFVHAEVPEDALVEMLEMQPSPTSSRLNRSTRTISSRTIRAFARRPTRTPTKSSAWR